MAGLGRAGRPRLRSRVLAEVVERAFDVVANLVVLKVDRWGWGRPPALGVGLVEASPRQCGHRGPRLHPGPGGSGHESTPDRPGVAHVPARMEEPGE